MRAVRIHSFGGPEVLELETVPEAEPGPGEVLLRSGGELRPTLHEVLPLAEARRAHEVGEAGHVRGTLVLDPTA